MSSSQTFSVNQRAAELVGRVEAAAAELRVTVTRGELGETLIDAGSRSRGSIAAGLRLAEICDIFTMALTPCSEAAWAKNAVASRIPGT